MDQNKQQNDSFDQKKNQIMGEMKQETQRYADTAKEYMNTAVDKVGQTVDQAKEKGMEVRQQLEEKGQQVKQQFENASQVADKYAHEKPWHLIAFAGVVGFAIGLLCRDSHRRRE